MLRSIVLFTLAYIVGSSCTVRALCPLYSKDYNTIWPRQGEARIETAFIDYCPSVSGASVGATLSGQSSSEDYSFKAPSSYRSADGSYTLVCRYTYPTEDLDGVEVFRKRADTTYDCTYTGGGSQSLTPAASNDQNECPTIQADAAEPSAGFSRRQAEKRATKLTYVCARKPEYLTNDADTSINVDEIYLLTATIRKGSFASAGTDGSFEYDCNYHTQDTATGETCSYTWDSTDNTIPALASTAAGVCPRYIAYYMTDTSSNVRRRSKNSRELIWQEPSPYAARQVNARKLRRGRYVETSQELAIRAMLEERC